MRIATLLPPSNAMAEKRAAETQVKLAPVCPIRMAEADRADEEFADLCEEVSRVHKRPPRVGAAQ